MESLCPKEPARYCFDIALGEQVSFKLSRIIILTVVPIFLGSAFSACATRSYTRPHSQILAGARSDSSNESSTAIRSAQEDRQVFESYEKANLEKLQKFLEERRDYDPSKDYAIGVGDTIEVIVYGIEELNTTARVDEAGLVMLPLLGGVQLKGLSEVQASEYLKERLSRHLKHPQALVRVKDFSGHQVSVVGAVSSPGRYALKSGQSSLIKVLSLAGGLANNAGNFVTILPFGSGLPTDPVGRARALLENKNIDAQERGIDITVGSALGLQGVRRIEIPVRAGDTVIVQPSGQVMVEGEVERRGSYALGANMTLVGALAAAGGITYGAKYDEIEVIRQVGPQRVFLVFNLDHIRNGQEDNLLLRNGDVVRVPSETGKRISQDFFRSLLGFVRLGGNIQTN